MKAWLRLVIAVIVLIIVVAVLRWPHKAAPAAAAGTPLVSLKASDVHSITIHQPGQPDVVLTKSGSDWKLDQPYAFAADATAAGSLISSLGDLTSAKKVADVTPSVKLATFGLDPAAAGAQPSTVEFGLSSGKNVLFTFGDDTPTSGNAYVRVGDSGPIEMVPSYVKEDALKSAFQMQDKSVLHFPSGQITAVDIIQNNNRYHFTKDKNAWPKAQSDSLTSLIEALGDGQMNAMPDPTPAAAAKDAAKFGLTHPATIVTLAWKGGSATLDIGAKKGAAEYYARNDASPAIFTLSDYLLTDITNVTTPPKKLSVASSK